MKQLFIALISIVCLTGCTKEQTFNDYTVKILFAPNSIGVNGDCADDILSKVTANQSINDYSLEYIEPKSLEEGEKAYVSWLKNTSVDSKTIIIVASNEYERTVINNASSISSQKVVVVDANLGESMPIYSFELSNYGTSFLVGASARVVTARNEALFIGAYPNAKISEASAGYLAGFKRAGGQSVKSLFISDSEAGFNMKSEAYNLAENNLSDVCPFVYTFADNSNLGVIDYVEENSDYYAATNQMFQVDASSKVVCAPIENFGVCVTDYINSFLYNMPVSKHLKFGLASGYVGLKISDDFLGGTADDISAYLEFAVTSEAAYLQKK